MTFSFSPPPTDRDIIRVHKLWKCIICVRYKPGLVEDCPWVTRTQTNSWPEESFLPNVWAESMTNDEFEALKIKT